MTLLNAIKHCVADHDNQLLLTKTPMVIMHLACIGVFFTGFSWVALAALLVTYFVRVFALTAGF
ncbi:MAG: acyl-CoA desaturase, partial [Verrucomicrobia bacterium]|nr:acyl-CoA desaturase [Verrucomicrobiota bacterium]